MLELSLLPPVCSVQVCGTLIHGNFSIVELCMLVRRQQGQPLVSGMCVVVQEMVTSAVAGVIFTADPVTGEAGTVTITANWGLGETVVSGTAEPDTLVLNSDTGDIIETRIGTKMIR